MDRRELLKKGALGGLGLASLGALSRTVDITAALAAPAPAMGPGITSQLIAAAKKDGHLNVIADPRDWANYGEIIDTFTKTYGISLTDEIPEGSSSQEIQAIESFKGQSRGPDVVDVSPAYAIKGQKLGLWTPYKVATWDTIPANLKEATGQWYGDYWGVIAFMSNNNLVKDAPKDWSDLLSPKLRNAVSMGDSPVTSGEAFGSVFAAALAHGGSLDNIQPGIDFFAKLKKAGNFNPAQGKVGNFGKGLMSVTIRWDYLLLADRDTLNGNPPVTINVPKSGTYGQAYFLAISKYAPNPNAAKLWMEFLLSDQGQILYLKGYTHPIRYADLAARGKIPAALAAKLPPAAAYKNVPFATPAQVSKANAIVAAQWRKVMG